MAAKVLDVGNCTPDHSAIRAMLLEAFDVQLDRVMFVDQALAALQRDNYDLVLVNRLIFDDGSDGLALVQRMQADPALRDKPVMMISNYEDAQARAMAAGAVRGFGKDALGQPGTIRLLAQYLPGRTAARAMP